jgi:pyrimidine operon attenuation protein/uracil phosphoribosyltransferase
MAHEIAEHNPDSSTVVLAGVQKGGIHLAARLGSILEGIWGHPVPVGAIDVSMHRDDLDRQPAPTIQPTEIPFDLNGKTVVLVDDVLFSGRTARAALDALNDFGRPHCVQLAVLVDRGHRQLPIMANFIGKEVVTALPERISLHLKEVGGDDVVYLESQPLATLQP